MREDFFNHVRAFYEANRQGLYTYALSLTRNRPAAEDAVQAAVFSLLRRGRLPGNIRPYVFRCVRNAALDIRRLDGFREEAFLDQPAPGDEGNSPLDHALLMECLDRINGDERETIVLKILEGLTFREIARIRRVSINTASSWYRRGLEKMKSMLEEKGR